MTQEELDMYGIAYDIASGARKRVINGDIIPSEPESPFADAWECIQEEGTEA